MQPSSFKEMDVDSESQSRSRAFPNTDRSSVLLLSLPLPQIDQAEAYLTDRERIMHTFVSREEAPTIVHVLLLLDVVNLIVASPTITRFHLKTLADARPKTDAAAVILGDILCFLSRGS
jgi:hypothetical protein